MAESDEIDAVYEGLTPAQVAAMQYAAYLPSDSLDPAWVAGWHAAVDHVTVTLARLSRSASMPEEGQR